MKIRLFLIGFLALALFGLARFTTSTNTQPQSHAAAKIAPWLRAHSTAGKVVEALIILSERADLRPAVALATKEEKGQFVRDALYRKAAGSAGLA